MSDRRPSGAVRTAQGERNREIVQKILQAAGGKMFREELIKILSEKMSGAGYVISRQKSGGYLYETIEDGLTIIHLVSNEPLPLTAKPADLVGQQLGLFVAKVLKIQTVNATSPVTVTIKLVPLVVQNCTSYLQKAGNLEQIVPLQRGEKIRVTRVIDENLVLGTRAIQKPMEITLLPESGAKLIVNGSTLTEPFTLTIPDGHWLVFEPTDRTESVVVEGDCVVVKACMLYVSNTDVFDEGNSMPIPLTMDSNFMIGGVESIQLTHPYVGFVVLEDNLPPEFKTEYDRAFRPPKSGSDRYAAILALANHGSLAWQT